MGIHPQGLRVSLLAGASLYPECIQAAAEVQRRINETAYHLGVTAPLLSIDRGHDLTSREYRMECPDLSASALSGRAPPAGSIFVRNNALYVGARLETTVQPWPDPVSPNRAGCVVFDRSLGNVRAIFDADAMTPAEMVALSAVGWFQGIAPRGADCIFAAQVLAQLPVYDAAALLSKHSIDVIADLLARLLQDRLSITSFRIMAPLLAEETRVEWGAPGTIAVSHPGRLLVAAARPSDAAERRRVIARAVAVPDTLRRLVGSAPLQIWLLDETGGWFPNDADGQNATYFKSALIEQTRVAAATQTGILVTSAARRAYIADLLCKEYPNLIVAALHELPRDIPVQHRGGVHVRSPLDRPDSAATRYGFAPKNDTARTES